MKDADKRCPGVTAQIAKARRLNDTGRCWCTCVNDDIPKAEKLAAEGKCLGAGAVIRAALARCNDDAGSGGDAPATPDFAPIQPWLPGGEE